MRTVFHHSEREEADHVLSNCRNLLADETVDLDAVAVVANGDGVYLLAEDGDHADAVADLIAEGVAFLACRNSLSNRDLDPDDLLPDVETTASGVGELTRKQSRGFAYVKP